MCAKTVEDSKNIESVSLQEAIDLAILHYSNTPPDKSSTIVFIGPPGCGKTDAAKQVAAMTTAFEHKKKGMSLVTRHLSQVHPLDMAGVGLDNQKREMYYAEPPLLAETLKAPSPRLVFLDEIDRAQPMAQSAMLQFILSGELNGYKCEDTYRIAAMNGWHAQYTYELDKATASRLAILNVIPSKKDWMRWAAANGIDVRIIMTIEAVENVLNEHRGDSGDTKGNNDGALKVADPRAWEKLSDALKGGWPTDMAGVFVGRSAAKKFELYARIQHDYSREIAQVLAGKQVKLQTVDITERNRLLFCIYLAAAAQIKAGDIKTARNFLFNGSEQMDKERCYVASKIITYTIPSQELCKDPEIQKLHLEMVDEMEGR